MRVPLQRHTPSGASHRRKLPHPHIVRYHRHHPRCRPCRLLWGAGQHGCPRVCAGLPGAGGARARGYGGVSALNGVSTPGRRMHIEQLALSSHLQAEGLEEEGLGRVRSFPCPRQAPRCLHTLLPPAQVLVKGCNARTARVKPPPKPPVVQLAATAAPPIAAAQPAAPPTSAASAAAPTTSTVPAPASGGLSMGASGRSSGREAAAQPAAPDAAPAADPPTPTSPRSPASPRSLGYARWARGFSLRTRMFRHKVEWRAAKERMGRKRGVMVG